MAQDENRECYKLEIAPKNNKQNCAIWDFDNLSVDNAYIQSIHFREMANILSPILAFASLSSVSKLGFFDSMRGSFLGSASINSIRFFAPIVIFKKSVSLYLNDMVYEIYGYDLLLQLAKDINKLLDNVCGVEFILNWLGSYCTPYDKNDAEDEAQQTITQEGSNPVGQKVDAPLIIAQYFVKDLPEHAVERIAYIEGKPTTEGVSSVSETEEGRGGEGVIVMGEEKNEDAGEL